MNGDEALNLRYPINDAINQWVYDHPDRADLHDPDTRKELARSVRDELDAAGYEVTRGDG